MNSDRDAGLLAQLLVTDVDDDVVRALSDRDRRYTLYYLLDDDVVSLDRLSDVLAGWRAVTDRRVMTEVDRESTRITLHHSHLPKLTDSSLVTFDRERGEVEQDAGYERARTLIEAAYQAEGRTGATSQ